MFGKKKVIVEIRYPAHGQEAATVFYKGTSVFSTGATTGGALTDAEIWCANNGYKIDNVVHGTEPRTTVRFNLR